MPSSKYGLINYINSIFFWGPIVLEKIPHTGSIFFESPALLNEQMLKAQLDASMVSASAYLQNQDRFYLSHPFCVSAREQVLSVALFTPVSVENLAQMVIYVTPQSASSVKLLEILAQKCWGFRAQIKTAQNPAKHRCYLLIGDECLSHPEPAGYHKIDLAQQWFALTGLPFVFGVFAQRKLLFGQLKEWEEMIPMAFEWSQQHMDLLLDLACQQTALPKKLVQTYLCCLDYQLSDAHLESMQLFQEWSALVS